MSSIWAFCEMYGQYTPRATALSVYDLVIEWNIYIQQLRMT